jgi:hypothetical protein
MQVRSAARAHHGDRASLSEVMVSSCEAFFFILVQNLLCDSLSLGLTCINLNCSSLLCFMLVISMRMALLQLAVMSCVHVACIARFWIVRFIKGSFCGAELEIQFPGSTWPFYDIVTVLLLASDKQEGPDSTESQRLVLDRLHRRSIIWLCE